MKTITIFLAYDSAEYDVHFQIGKSYRMRQRDKFRAALLARIEQGDRARECLKQVEWGDGSIFQVCPWCEGNKRIGHASDCPRQIALGLNE